MHLKHCARILSLREIKKKLSPPHLISLITPWSAFVRITWTWQRPLLLTPYCTMTHSPKRTRHLWTVITPLSLEPSPPHGLKTSSMVEFPMHLLDFRNRANRPSVLASSVWLSIVKCVWDCDLGMPLVDYSWPFHRKLEAPRNTTLSVVLHFVLFGPASNVQERWPKIFTNTECTHHFNLFNTPPSSLTFLFVHIFIFGSHKVLLFCHWNQKPVTFETGPSRIKSLLVVWISDCLKFSSLFPMCSCYSNNDYWMETQ